MGDRTILHADMDAFYASVEQRDRPELRGRPVVVGGTSSRGVVSAASYEARRFGIHSAMPTVEARRRCPDAVFLRGDMARYTRESRRVFEIFRRFTPLVEGLSLDEAYLDLTGTERLLGPARAVGERLRDAVREELGLPVSVGIGTCKLVAKIASDLAKPDGLLEVPARETRSFLAPLEVGRMGGIGPVARERLERAGVRTLGELAALDAKTAERWLGAFGATAVALARGEDARAVRPDRAPVSVSEENTFATDVEDPERLAAAVRGHAESVAARLRRSGLVARAVVVKARSAHRARAGPRGYPLHTRRTTLPAPTDDGAVLAEAALALLERLPRGPVRLLGVGATDLSPADAGQLGLFEALDPDAQRRARLNRAMDALAERYGARVVVRAGAVPLERAGLTEQRKRGTLDDDAPA